MADVLLCQIGQIASSAWGCPNAATAAVGAVRLCDSHLATMRDIAHDAGLTDAEIDAEIGQPGVRRKKHRKITRRCECGTVYESTTHHRASPLCPACRAPKPKPRPARKPRERAHRPPSKVCECGTEYAIARRGGIPERCPLCRAKRELELNRVRQREAYHASKARAAA